jgi:hypothetical protein
MARTRFVHCGFVQRLQVVLPYHDLQTQAT